MFPIPEIITSAKAIESKRPLNVKKGQIKLTPNKNVNETMNDILMHKIKCLFVFNVLLITLDTCARLKAIDTY